MSTTTNKKANDISSALGRILTSKDGTPEMGAAINNFARLVGSSFEHVVGLSRDELVDLANAAVEKALAPTYRVWIKQNVNGTIVSGYLAKTGELIDLGRGHDPADIEEFKKEDLGNVFISVNEGEYLVLEWRTEEVGPDGL